MSDSLQPYGPYIAHQAPLPMGFSRQEHWSGLPCHPLGDLPNPETEPISLMSPAFVGKFFTTSTTWESPVSCRKTSSGLPLILHYGELYNYFIIYHSIIIETKCTINLMCSDHPETIPPLQFVVYIKV